MSRKVDKVRKARTSPVIEAKPTWCVADVSRRFLDAVLDGQPHDLPSNRAANPTRRRPRAVSPALVAALTLAAMITGAGGCQHVATARERYFASRQIVVESKQWDHSNNRANEAVSYTHLTLPTNREV